MGVIHIRNCITLFFLVLSGTLYGQNAIVSYEYWFDDAFQSRIASNVSPVETLEFGQVFTLDTMTAGIHYFNFRVLENTGTWSSIQRSYFIKLDHMPPVTKEIVAYEYWVNGDFENRTVVNTAPSSVINFSDSFLFDTLADGIHYFNFRVLENTGTWSSIQRSYFIKRDYIPPVTKELIAYEYWVNDDFENRTNVSTTPSSVINFTDSFLFDTLTDGIHYFNFRVLENTGTWSSVQRSYFIKQEYIAPVTKELIAYEYWLDSDFETRTIVNSTPSNIITFSDSFLYDTLADGIHYFNFRVLENTGAWSSVQRSYFIKQPVQSVVEKNLVAYEYWLDNDFINRTTVNTSPSGFINFTNNFSFDTLSNGIHYFNFRVAENTGSWSSVLRNYFIKTAPQSATIKKIVSFEYWFDEDYDQKKTHVFANPESSVYIDTLISCQDIQFGVHTLSFRFLDSHGHWSASVTQLINYNSVASFTVIPGEVDFGTLATSTTFVSQEQFTIINTGNSSVTIDSLVVADDLITYTVLQNYTIAVGDSVAVDVYLNRNTAIQNIYDKLYIYSAELLTQSTEHGFVAYFPFAGNANDETGNGNDATVSGAVLTDDRFGTADAAYSFDGTDDYIQVWNTAETNANINTDEGTISCWAQSGYTGFLFQYYSGNNDRLYVQKSGVNEFYIGIGDSYEVVPVADLKEWNLYVLKWRYGNYQFSVNDSLIFQGTFGNPGFTFKGSEKFYIGRGWNNNPAYFQGIIDDVRFYDRMITQQEVKVLYGALTLPIRAVLVQPSYQITVNPATVDFGSLGISSQFTTTKSAWVVNSGTSEFIIDSIGDSHPLLTTTDVVNAVVLPNDSLQVDLTLDRDTTVMDITDDIQIHNPHIGADIAKISVVAQLTDPIESISINPTVINYGSLLTSTKDDASETFWITNTGNTEFIIDSIIATDELFSADAIPGGYIPLDDSVEVSVTLDLETDLSALSDSLLVYNPYHTPDTLSLTAQLEEGFFSVCTNTVVEHPWWQAKDASGNKVVTIDESGNMHVNACTITYGSVPAGLTNSYIIRTSNGDTVFAAGNTGVYVKDTVYELVDTITDNVTKNFIIRNASNEVVARIGEDGVFYLKGELCTESIEWQCGCPITDIQGNEYATIELGNQCWMAENIKTTRYNDGADIPKEDDGALWAALNTPAFSWYGNDSATYHSIYGPLYNWYVIETNKLCPLGWHIPSDDEWKELELNLGMPVDEVDLIGLRGIYEGGQLKEPSLTYWQSPNTIGQAGSSGFNALPAGVRHFDGSFNFIGTHAYWRTSTAHFTRIVNYMSTRIDRQNNHPNEGYSVRCIKD